MNSRPFLITAGASRAVGELSAALSLEITMGSPQTMNLGMAIVALVLGSGMFSLFAQKAC